MVLKHSLIVLLMGLSACASVEKVVSPEPQTPIHTNRLAPVELAPGACGWFVWTGDEQKRFILYSEGDYSGARWLSGGREQTLEFVSDRQANPETGDNPHFVFNTSDGMRLELNLREAQAITNGTRYKSGVLKHSSEEGWERITPVVGLSACRPVSSNSP